MAASHRRGLLSRWLRPQMHRQVEHLFDVASTRLGISSAMCVAYEDRFGYPFAAFQNTIDTARWQHLAKRKLETGSPAELLYVGSIFANAQLDSLMDCCKAVAALNGKGIAVRLTVVTPRHFAERYESLLRIHPAIRMEIATADDELFFRRIAAADVLLLPVSFDDDSVRTIRYSMPTKVPAYLGCGAPILVYGPATTAQVGYALESGWGHVVARREATALEGGICRVIDDQPLRRRLIARARKSARENHDVTTVRQGFQDLLCSVGHRPDRTREAASA